MGYLGQASSSETGGTSGVMGDQTGSEINKKAFYKLPWHTYLECTDTELAQSAAKYMTQIINDNNFGYSQPNRWTGYNSIKANGGKVSGAKGDFDCSSLVISCYLLAGLNTSVDGSTANLKSKMLATGKFKAYTDSTHINSDSAASKGGIYIGNGHAAMSLGSSSSSSSEVTKRSLGTFTLTAYCPCSICCGKSDGITASGVKAQANHTIAVDPSVISLGSKVEINGTIYTAEDTGGAIKGNRIDIFFASHSEALAFGKKTAEVYLITGDVKESSSGSKKELTSVTVASVVGDGGARKEYTSLDSDGSDYELYIVHGSDIFMPVVQDDVTWKTVRKSSPGSLKFTVLKDDKVNFTEGDTVIFKHNTDGVFYGYVFEKTRSDDDSISVTAYDQLRYFKNKDTYIYKEKRADEIFKMICDDFLLNTGDIENTGYVIPQRIEDNSTLFDIVGNAFDETLENTGKQFFIYDDFGKLALKNVNSMRLNLLLTKDVARGLSYTSSIDKETYNKIQLYADDDESGERKKYIYQDGTTISSWGVLQLTQKLEEDEYPDVVGKQLLDTYNRKSRSLSVSDVFGDVRARAGTSIAVNLALGDISVNTFMTVEEAEHKFKHNEYTMSLKLSGGEFTS